MSLDEHVLKIDAEREDEDVEEKERYWIAERMSGRVVRSVRLPTDVNEEDVSSQYRGGVLSVVVPKKAPEHHKRKKIRVD